MDGELVSSLTSSDGESGSDRTTLPNAYKDTFEELFPYYLSIGMTEEQYWDRDCELVKAYRKADEMRTERNNMMMWLQGKYIYDAMLEVSPIFHAFAKRGTKPQPYAKEPYPITQQRAKEIAQEKEQARYNRNKVFMETFKVKNNQAFKEIEQKGVS